jgi:DNA ligase-1
MGQPDRGARCPTADLSRPYPFYLAYQLDGEPETLGPVTDWLAERKWDGIRGQLILRGGAFHWLWSRGEELITDRFPELPALRDFLPPGTVIDGEVLAWTAPPRPRYPSPNCSPASGARRCPRSS